MTEEERQRLIAIANESKPPSPQSYVQTSPQGDISPSEVERLKGVAAQIKDDSWGARLKDVVVGLGQGFSYDWLDDAFSAMGIENVSDAYSIAQQRNPYSTLGANVVGGIAVDAGIYAGLGSVLPGAGTAVGGVAGLTKGVLSSGSKLSRGYKQIQAMKNLSARTGKLAGIGALHGAAAGAGYAEDAGQTRLQGAKEGALYGGAFGAAIPIGGAALRGGVRLGRAGARSIANTSIFNNALVNNQVDTLLTFQKNPQATSSNVVASVSDVLNRTSEIAQASVDSLYKGIRSRNPVVDVGPAQGAAAKLSQKYQNLGRDDVVQQLKTVFGRQAVSSFDDALYLRKQLFKMRGQLQPKDFDELYTEITRQIERGTKASGIGSDWLKAENAFKDYRSTFETGYFAKAMKDGGLASDDIDKSLRSGAIQDKFTQYQRVLNQMSAQGLKNEANAIRDDIQSIAIQKLATDERFLNKMLNNPDTMSAITFDNKPLLKLFQELKTTRDAATSDRGFFKKTGGFIKDVVGDRNSTRGLATRGALAYASSGTSILTELVFVVGEQAVGRALQNPRIVDILRRLQKASDPTEAMRLKQRMRSEAVAAGLLFGGVLNTL